MSLRSVLLAGLLATISSVVAVPVAPTGTAPAFYAAGNRTDGFYGMSGSGLPTGTGHRRHRSKSKTTTTTATVKYATQDSPLSAAAAGHNTTTCTTSTVYSTTTNKITVTVTASKEKISSGVAAPVASSSEVQEAVAPSVSAAPSYAAEAPASYATPAAPVASVNAPAASSHAAEAPASYATPAAPVAPNSAPAASSHAAEAQFSYAAPAASKSASVVSSVAVAPVAAPTSSTVSVADAPPSYTNVPSSPGSSPGSFKRGLAYNDAKLTSCFENKRISWAYNWASTPSGLGSAFEFVPTLWGTGAEKTASWEKDAKAAIAAGSTHLFSFNEPDHFEQANISPAEAAAGYKKYMHDMFGGSNVKLGAPSVTNGGGSMGLTYLKNFMDACKSCQIDFINVHWYDSATNIEYFKKHIKQAHEQSGKPVWITEFGAAGSDDQVNQFLQAVLPWLDSQDYVERYSYFMAKDGMMNKGSEMSTYGRTFASFTG